MKNSLILILFLCFNKHIFCQNVVFGNDSTYLALTKKGKFEKPVFLDFYTEWCVPCKKMDKTTLQDSSVQKFLNDNFISFKIDAETVEGERLFRKFGNRLYPLFVFLKDSATVLHKTDGYNDVQEFQALMRVALDTNQNIYGLLKKYERGEKGEYLKKLAYYYYNPMLGNADVQKFAKEYLLYNPEWGTEENLSFLKDVGRSIDFIGMPYIYKNKETFVSRFGESYIQHLEEDVIPKNLSWRFLDLNESKQKRDSLMNFLSALPPTFDNNKLMATARIFQARREDKDSLVCRLICEYMQTYTVSHYFTLDSHALTIAERSTEQRELLLAINWILKALETKDNYDANDTAALLYFKTNNKAKAKEYAEKAIRIAEKDGGSASTTKELLEKINQMK